MGEKTTIEIEKETRRRLKVWKAQHDMTYDEGINHLIEKEEADEEAREFFDQMEQAEVVTQDQLQEERDEMLTEAFDVLQEEAREADSDIEQIVINPDEITYVKSDPNTIDGRDNQ